MNYVARALELLSQGLDIAWHLLREQVREHPGRALLALWIVGRLLGTTIQTGQRGVRFRFGRVRSALEPGFHWKMPGLEAIRIVPTRSQTLDLEGQRLSTPKGLVLEIDANLVFRVDDPIKALVEIDDYREGCFTALALAVQQVVWRYGDEGLSDLELWGRELAAALRPRLERWGIAVEDAGFTTLAPSARTLRYTQLGVRLAERRRVLAHLGETLDEQRALALLGSTRLLRERSSAHYRRLPLRNVRRVKASKSKVELFEAALEAL